jgi:hypothetical protein
MAGGYSAVQCHTNEAPQPCARRFCELGLDELERPLPAEDVVGGIAGSPTDKYFNL